MTDPEFPRLVPEPPKLATWEVKDPETTEEKLARHENEIAMLTKRQDDWEKLVLKIIGATKA